MQRAEKKTDLQVLLSCSKSSCAENNSEEGSFGKILLFSGCLPSVKFSFGAVWSYKLCLKIRSHDMTGVFWVSLMEYLHIVQSTGSTMVLTTLISNGIRKGVLKASEQSGV